jgi:hypothetical protein
MPQRRKGVRIIQAARGEFDLVESILAEEQLRTALAAE